MLDQFSRNVYRDTARAFAQDALALVLAQELVTSGQDRSLPLAKRSFAYMPYMHSESALVHAQAVFHASWAVRALSKIWFFSASLGRGVKSFLLGRQL